MFCVVAFSLRVVLSYVLIAPRLQQYNAKDATQLFNTELLSSIYVYHFYFGVIHLLYVCLLINIFDNVNCCANRFFFPFSLFYFLSSVFIIVIFRCVFLQRFYCLDKRLGECHFDGMCG